MEDITFRKFRRHDLPFLQEWVTETWQLDEYVTQERNKEICAKAFTYSYLIAQNYSCVAEYQGKVAGFLFGKYHGKTCLPSILRYGLYFLWNGLRLLLSKDGKMNVAIMKATGKADEELLEEQNLDFNGELVLFITDKEVRGKGIGKALNQKFMDYMKTKIDTGTIFLFTDSLCNVGYYERNGYERLGERSVTVDTERGNFHGDFYIYSKNIS